MTTILSLIGMVAAFYMMKYRQQIGDFVGESEFVSKIGGIYNVIVLVAIFLFFWSLAALTGTLDIFFLPLTYVIPGMRQWE